MWGAYRHVLFCSGSRRWRSPPFTRCHPDVSEALRRVLKDHSVKGLTGAIGGRLKSRKVPECVGMNCVLSFVARNVCMNEGPIEETKSDDNAARPPLFLR